MAEYILLVDDDLQTRTVVARLLEKADYEVNSVDSGCEILEIIHQKKPNLILLDLEMPKKHGFDVLVDLKEDEQARNIPVIVFSARKKIEDKVTVLELGSIDYIVKPAHPDELLARVKAAIRRCDRDEA